MNYIIGTRGSKLALAQANFVKKRLADTYPEHSFEIRVIRTKGDVILDKPLYEIGDKGVFVKEIEEELLGGRADIGVHSMKDMPSQPAKGLMFTKAWMREDPRDALILREKKSLADLPEGAVIGTGSKRRKMQLIHLRPDLTVVNLRGNVDTRLQKMEEEKFDGIVLAAAGLKRLGLLERVTQFLDTEEFLPAPAQGVLALEIRKGDKALLDMLDALCDEDAACAVELERGFLREIGGDCHAPVGAFGRKGADGTLFLSAMFGNPAGDRLAYAKVSGRESEVLVRKAAACIRQQVAGTVFLVGAGPGDPDLITVKGLTAIRKADCIIYDRLAAPELLDEARSSCELIYAGKENHNHTMRQEEINLLLVKKSMEYGRVVRLKGGDVYVFGRGGEEGMFLKEHGVPFEVIPGISSAVCAPACAGIPVTHRGLASGFHVVTAHDRRDRLAEIDFESMAKGQETCVFLMGLGRIGEIADRLMEAGMPRQTKVAVISRATTSAQTCVSDLEHIAKEVKQAQFSSPAVIVVGEVVSLREPLNFFEQKPLFGKRYLIPKIGQEKTRLRELLCEKGAAVDELLVGQIRYPEGRLAAEELQSADWLVFTSKNGVDAFFQKMAASGLDMRCLARCKIAVIGKKTALELQRHGLYADLIPEHFHSDALAEELKKYLQGSEKVCYLKAGNADSHLKEALEGVCCMEEIIVYENCAIEPDLEQISALEEYDGILFTCTSSTERFLGIAAGKLALCQNPGPNFYSIGPKTTACLYAHRAKAVIEATEASYECLVQAVETNECFHKKMVESLQDGNCVFRQERENQNKMM